ncbi:clarin-3-like [Apostichopus japonicus]|uniref:clarin-3-like n=1 Tax=Stichopus japonicus TaxID=307972 RepID=UPI003AB66F44
MTNKIQKLLYLDVFIVSLIVLGCFLTAICTNQMVVGKLKHPRVTALNYGNIKFGLIWGTKQYNYGYGDRDEETYLVYNEYEDQHNIPLIITTLSFIGVATIFTVVSTIFALMNTITVPIQTIHGSLGLYIWNGIAGGFGLLSIILYTIMFETTIKDNIQSPNEDEFSTEDPAKVGYSFWLLLCGVILVTTNIGIVYLAGKAADPDFFKRKSKIEVNEKQQNEAVADGIMF